MIRSKKRINRPPAHCAPKLESDAGAKTGKLIDSEYRQLGLGLGPHLNDCRPLETRLS